MVGTSGRSNQRRMPVTASAFSAPDSICGCAGGSAAKATCVVPLSRAWIAGPAPENGTWVMLTSQTILNSSPDRSGAGPVLDHRRAVERFAEMGGENARHDVGWPCRRERHDDLDRMVGISRRLRRLEAGGCDRRDQGAARAQNLAARPESGFTLIHRFTPP